MIVEMEPLADAEIGRVIREDAGGAFWGAILAQEAHVEVPVIGRALGLLMPRRRWPGLRQVEQGIPVDARHPPDQQFGGAAQSELLHLLGPEAGGAAFRYPDR